MLLSLRLCLFFLAIQLALFADRSQAQLPFRIVETGIQQIFTNSQDAGYAYVHIENMTGSQIWLTADVLGGPRFGLHPNHRSFTIYPDSTFRIRVVYFPVPGDTSQGYLVVRDSIGYSDTLEILAIDTRSPLPTDRWIGYYSNTNFGSYYWMPDTLNLIAHNKSADTVDITATILSGSYGITLNGAAQRTVYSNEMERFRFDFDSEGNDSGYAHVVLPSTDESDTIELRARVIGDTLYWYWRKDYLNIPAGDTLCQTITIRNNTQRDASINDLSFVKGDQFYLSSGPSLPHLIEAGDSLELTVCYISPSSNSYTEDGLAVTFKFADQVSRRTAIALFGSSLECDMDADRATLDFGAVPHGTTAWESIWIRNRHSLGVSIDSISFGGDQRFGTNVQNFPLTIPGLDSARIDIRYIPGSRKDTAGYAVFYSRCTVIYTDLVIDVNDNDSGVALYADQAQSLAFYGDSSYSSVVYRFYNDQQDSIRILSVSLAQGDHFSITSIQPSMPEFKLGPEDEMSVTVQFIGNPGSYDDTLVIVTETGVIALRFPLDAVISGSSVSQSPDQNIIMNLSPNPSMGPVSIQIDGGQVRSIEVIDMLGTVIHKLGSDERTFDSNSLPAGTYFVRASGIDPGGEPFVVTRRLIRH